MNRRELFGRFNFVQKDKNDYQLTIRPPYYNQEQDFELCLDCEYKPCIVSCEENIIYLKDHKPSLEFQSGGCTYCDDCAVACPSGVLDIKYKKYIKASFKIDTIKCMSWQGTMCFSCKDPCLDGAIVFDGLFKPTINDSLCTSCGFCVKPCPTIAIEIFENKKENI